MIYTEYQLDTGEITRQFVCTEEQLPLQCFPGCAAIEGRFDRVTHHIKGGTAARRAEPLLPVQPSVGDKRLNRYLPVGEQLGSITKAFAYLQGKGVDIGPDGGALVAAAAEVKALIPALAPALAPEPLQTLNPDPIVSLTDETVKEPLL